MHGDLEGKGISRKKEFIFLPKIYIKLWLLINLQCYNVRRCKKYVKEMYG